MPDSSHLQHSSNPIPAASLILLQDTEAGIEVFMVARNYEVDSFSGALVFPGGKLHAADSEPEARKYCRNHQNFDDEQLALRIAAIREAFEESGVLLGRSKATGDFIDESHMQKLSVLRTAVESGDLELLELAKQENIELATDLLVHFSNLVTPQGWVKKRFDTHFYIAALPRNYQLVHDGGETVSSLWGQPDFLIAEADQGKWNIVFPTRVNLSKIAVYDSSADLLSTCLQTSVEKITPQVDRQSDHVTLSIPEDAGFPFYRQQIRRSA